MSATEAVATKPEETKAMAEEPVVPTVEAAVVPIATPADEAKPADAVPAADAKPTDAKPADVPATDAMPKDETKPEPKGSSKILGLFKSFTLRGGDKKPKAPKSPKKEKETKKDKKEEKKEEPLVVREEAPVATQAAEAATSVEVPKAEEVTIVTDSAQATQNPVAALAEEVKEAVKEAAKEISVPKETKDAHAPKASKLARRISQQVSDIFRPKPKPDVSTSPKVDELPPKIEQPQLVAPLEDPASEPAKAQEPAEVATPPMATTAVAATA